MFKKFLIVAALMSTPAFGEFHLIEMERFDMEFYEIKNHRDSYFPYNDPDKPSDEHWTNGYATNFNLNLVGTENVNLYLNNRVHGEATNSQVRQVGWKYELGVGFFDRLDLFWHHHSQHVLDASSNVKTRFPLDNFYGFRMNFYQKQKK